MSTNLEVLVEIGEEYELTDVQPQEAVHFAGYDLGPYLTVVARSASHLVVRCGGYSVWDGKEYIPTQYWKFEIKPARPGYIHATVVDTLVALARGKTNEFCTL